MKRRGFIETMLKAGVGFTILPPATTYSRIWRAERRIDTEYRCIMLPPVNHYSFSSEGFLRLVAAMEKMPVSSHDWFPPELFEVAENSAPASD